MLKHRRSELLLILSALMFASNGVSSKLLLSGHISAWRLAQVRAIGATTILFLYLLIKARTKLRITKAEMPRLAAMGALGIAPDRIGIGPNKPASVIFRSTKDPKKRPVP